MNRADWQQIAEERLIAARNLLAASNWSSAYYLAGYAVECGLKSCILAHLQNSPEVIFDDKQFSVRCWTHDINQLIKLAGCELDRDADCDANPLLRQNWEVVGSWNEASRYDMTPEFEARELYNAIADNLNGVIQWLKQRW